MSSHREAPETAKDPVADSTDVYAFVSPDRPDTVTLIANYIPFQAPDGGPNFYEFGEDVTYDIHVSNKGKGEADITYRFHFHTKVRNPKTFLYNTGPITSLGSASWNRPQFYSVTRIRDGKAKVLAERLACPPVNIGPRSTPNYADLASSAVHKIGRRRVFAGQRADAFHVDLGAIFDLLDLRPFQNLHLIPTAAAHGINALANANVHTIALQVPITDFTGRHRPTKVRDAGSTIGVWTTAARKASRIHDGNDDRYSGHGPWRQVSRLGNPLVNEVLIPMGLKDVWNARPPYSDRQFLEYVQRPEVAKLLPVLYPGVFPNLAKLTAHRADLVAILLTGIPEGVVPGFQNFTGPTYADVLRLNLAVKPTAPGSANPLGIIGGDLAGFPNGRRVRDDVVTIELRAIAGATYPLVAPAYKPDGAAALVTDGTTAPATPDSFPYLATPHDGFTTAVA